MKIKRIIAAVGAGALIAAGGVLAMAIPASAHNATLKGSSACSTDTGAATITWSVDNDWGQDAKVTVSDNAAIPVGSDIAAAAQNNGSKITTFTEQVSAPAAGKSDSAKITVQWSDGTVVQNIQSNTVTVGDDCTVPPSKDASAAAIVITAATCDAPGSAALGVIANAVLSGSLDLTPGDHTATFTAANGHEFADGTTSFSEDYTVPAQLAGDQCSTPPPPVTNQVCTSPGSVVSSDLGAWDTSDTRSAGHYEVTSDGLHIWTDGSSDVTAGVNQDKSSGYYPVSFALKDLGDYGIDQTVNSGGAASLQLTVDLEGDGSATGNLVHEDAYGADSLWLSSNWDGSDLTNAPTTIVSGGGTGNNGTINDWLAAYPNATVVAVGYSLGSGLQGDDVIKSLTAGCVTYTFAPVVVPVKPADKVVVTPTTKTLCTPQGGGGTDTTTTVTTTTPYVYDADSNTWVLGEATSKTIMDSHAATATECPAAIVKHVTPKVATVSTVLADTGSDTTMPVWIGLGAIAAGLLAGAAALVIRRRRV